MSDEKVVAFHPQIVGDGYVFDPDQILEAAKGQDMSEVVIIGTLPDGELWVSSTVNAGTSLILLHRAINKIVEG